MANAQSPAALEVVKKKMFLPKFEDALRKVLPKTVTLDRWLALAWQASKTLMNKPNLDANSVLVSLYEGAKCGLEFNPTFGEAYLVPFNCKVIVGGQKVYRNICTFIPGYRGLIKLARRAGIKDIQARVIMSNDDFDFYIDENGPHMLFRPVARNRGRPEWVISRAILEDGSYSIMDPLPWDKVEQIKQQNLKRSKGTGPWSTHEEEMGQKTGIRRHCKVLPQEALLSAAISLDEKVEELGQMPSVESADELDGVVDAQYREMIEASESDEIVEASGRPKISDPIKTEPKVDPKSDDKEPANKSTKAKAAKSPKGFPKNPKDGDVHITNDQREYHFIEGEWTKAATEPAPQIDEEAIAEVAKEKDDSAGEGNKKNGDKDFEQAELDLEPKPAPEPQERKKAEPENSEPEVVAPGLYASRMLQISGALGLNAQEMNSIVKEKFGYNGFMLVPVEKKVSVLKYFRSLIENK